MSLVIVDDLFKHYDLGFEDDDDSMMVYCDRCDDIVCTLSYENLESVDEMTLYERIIKEHKEI